MCTMVGMEGGGYTMVGMGGRRIYQGGGIPVYTPGWVWWVVPFLVYVHPYHPGYTPYIARSPCSLTYSGEAGGVHSNEALGSTLRIV